MIKDIENFIKLNEDRVKVTRDKDGIVTNVESLVDENQLIFFKTNCILEKKGFKNVLITKDGEIYNFSFKKDELKPINYLNRSFSSLNRKLKYFPKVIISKTKNVINNLNNKTNSKTETKVKIKSQTPIKNNPLGDYSVIKNDVDKLIYLISELFKRHSIDIRYNSDINFINLKNRYENILQRYDYAKKMNDTSEILNVRVKLTNLSGRLHELEKNKSNAKDKKNNINDKSIENKASNDNINQKNETIILTDYEKAFIEDAKAEGLSIKDPEFNQMLNERAVDKQKILNSFNVNNIVIPPNQEVVYKDYNTIITKPNVVDNKVSPNITKKENVKEEQKKEEKIDSYDETIKKMDDKIHAAESNAAEIRKHLEKTEEIINDAKVSNNLDSREIRLYEEEKIEKTKQLKEAEEIVNQKKEQKEKYKNEKMIFDIPNRYAKEGYIKKIMSREEYDNYLKEIDLLDKRIEIMNLKNQNEEETNNLQEKLKQIKEKTKVLEKRLSENSNELEKTNQIVSKEEPKPEILKDNDEPKVEETIIEKEDKSIRKKEIQEKIKNCNKNIVEIQNNITLFENELSKKQLYLDANKSKIDIIKITAYEKSIQNTKEKLNKQKKLLEEAQSEIKPYIGELSELNDINMAKTAVYDNLKEQIRLKKERDLIDQKLNSLREEVPETLFTDEELENNSKITLK